MRSNPALLLVLPVLLLARAACGGPGTAKTGQAEADKAFQATRYNDAVKHYDALIHWQGTEKLSKDDLFIVYLNRIRCKIYLKEFADAVKGLEGMREIYGAELKPKNYGTVIYTLVNQKAFDQAIDVIAIVGEFYPEWKEKLERYSEKIIEQGATPEQIQRLKDLGYL